MDKEEVGSCCTVTALMQQNDLVIVTFVLIVKTIGLHILNMYHACACAHSQSPLHKSKK